MRIEVLPTLSVLLAFVWTAPALGNSIENGEFETGNLAGWVNSGAVDVNPDSRLRAVGGTGTFLTGVYAAIFGGGNAPSTGVMSQEFDTEAGVIYDLSFDYGKFNIGAGDQSIQASVVNVANSASLLSETIVDSTTQTALGSVFGAYSYQFLAIGPSTRLAFRDVSPVTIATDGLLDNVTVVAVPEPSTLFLLAVAAVAIVAWNQRLRRPFPIRQPLG